MWNLIKSDKKELTHKMETDSKISNPNLCLPKGKHWHEEWIGIYTLPHTKSISNKDVLYSTGKSTQYAVITCMGKESEEKSGKISEKESPYT